MRYLADTNVLLRFVDEADVRHAMVFRAVQTLVARGDEIAVAPQVVYEFWSVVTRPTTANGLSWSPERARAAVDDLLRDWTLLTDKPAIFDRWLEFVTQHGVSGKQVHDVRLVAAMEAHGLEHLLTLNAPDFKRFPTITPVHPDEFA